MPLAPQKRVQRVLAKALDGRRHLALERLPTHLPVSDDFQSGFLLKRYRVIYRFVFNFLELCCCDHALGELLLRSEQLGRAKQAANYVRPYIDHG